MYEVRLTNDANWDFENVISHYSNISAELANYFITSFDETLLKLETFPFFQVRYKNVRLRQVKNFPVMLHYILFEELNLVVVYGVRFGQEDPENYPSV